MSNLGNLLNARDCFRRAKTELIMASNELDRTTGFTNTIKEIDDTVEDIRKAMDIISKYIDNQSQGRHN